MHFTASWLRAYHTRRLERAGEIVERLARTGLVQPNDDKSIAFYDIQALRASHFASGIGPQISLSLALDQDAPPITVETHLTAHASGFLVLRLSLTSAANPHLEHATPEFLSRLERLPWDGSTHVWRIGDTAFSASLRGCQNLLFLAAHEILVRGEFDLESLVPSAEDGPDGNALLHDLARRGELSHPFPVSFGTHFEIVVDSLPSLDECERIVDVVAAGSAGGAPSSKYEVVDPTADAPWYLFENQSFIFLPPDRAGADGVIEPDRVRLLEFMTLRRGALRSIQRDTQRVLTGGSDVSRRRIDEWRLLLATTTDDYVLHDRTSRLLVPMMQHLRTNGSVRDPERLETQVRTNINSFQARVDLASQSVSTILGALFAVVAAVVGVGAVAKAAVAGVLDVRVTELGNTHPWLTSGIDIVVTVGAFALTWVVIRRASARVPALRPYQVPEVRGRRRRPNQLGPRLDPS